ncbi:TIGR01777 family oxidoreductase [Sediminibacterium ginsengisoli]|uniref:TIGR01777 family protein n=1 Tax=Sediminibacterium ginsengisoli TaxID=413434 RepID=A0A1T4N1G2_9BACT|nr:TIGR01777 family oxidoreductase [Sediminibacterium ginsengisoli]SJZ72857.1 hypothetical protein SAMN04488132_10439 [Sediminibacterium ginsengisoli]
MKTVLITGGTGMVGQRLTALLLRQGYKIIILSRGQTDALQDNRSGVSYAHWDVEKGVIDPEAIRNANHVIHLAGAGVAEKRWTEKRKKEIRESRTASGALLAKAIREIPNQISTVVSASAIGWYGADDKGMRTKGFTEEMPPADDFLGETCRLWEQSIQPVEELNKRLVIYRLGIVFSNTGGALNEFLKPLKGGIAAILGSGEQMISWIHIDDLCHLFLHAIENPKLHGVYNAVSPSPATNKTVTLELARLVRGRFFIPLHVPSFLLKWVLGEMSIEVLKSATVSSRKTETAGFLFRYPTVQKALGHLFGK